MDTVFNMRVSVSPATMPEVRVEISGVLLQEQISAMNLNSSPSSATAQITRDIGNIAPSRLGGEGEVSRKYSIHKHINIDSSTHLTPISMCSEHHPIKTDTCA